MIFATSHDGVQVPISLGYRKDSFKKATNACILYGYGAYGLTDDPYFSASRIALLDRGIVYAIGHIRGGGEVAPSFFFFFSLVTFDC